MKIRIAPRRSHAAFTLLEVVVTTAIVGVIFASFYSGIAAGFSLIGLARENLRANQILLEKMETVRLYNWTQINSNGFIPQTFTAPFYPPIPGDTNTSPGVAYHGTLTVTNAPFDVGYNAGLKLVVVSLTWTNGNNPRTRSMETLVSEFGLQTYIY